MADDKTLRGPADAKRVNVHEAHEVRYWTGKWGVDVEQLKAAVEVVGPLAKDVAAYLKKPG